MSELEALTNEITELVSSPYSDFYRSLYGVPKGSRPNIHTWSDWNLVPTFTKDALLERPMREYTFLPNKDIEVIYYTSGTSGKPPFFCGRIKQGDIRSSSTRAEHKGFSHRNAFYDFKGAMLSSIKSQHRSDIFMSETGSRSFTINFDSKNITACMLLAKVAGVDSLAVHTFTIPAIGEEMKKFGINKNIKFIDLIGETCSLMLYSYMRETFPNAVIISGYGLSEVDGMVGIPCRALSDEEPYSVYHITPGFHLDFINPETGEAVEAEAGVEAEVLITDRSINRGLPLVRYRPGDTVRIVEKKCALHGELTFTVLGKTASDFMLVPGGQLRADEVERVLRTMPNEVTDHFEMHRYDGGTKEKPTVEVILHIQTSTPTPDLPALAERIAAKLRVSQNRTYADGVRMGIYTPLICKPLVEDMRDKKHRRMFRH